MGKYYPQIALQHEDSCVGCFGAKLKIALTGVRSRVREPLAKRDFRIFTVYKQPTDAIFTVTSYYP